MSRKPHAPTETTRNQVSVLAGFGHREDEIALYLNIDPKTLRKYYRRELDTGHIRANSEMASTLFSQAKNGSTSAAIFWLKSRAGWRENIDLNHFSPDGSMTPTRIVICGPDD